MRAVLLDGSNVSLHAWGKGRLTTLECLARVVNALLINDIIPYTVFDASLRWRTAENSVARIQFDHLTRNLKDHFQMSPRGEEADLFLLEMAAATNYPIVSNDTFQKYGGVRDGCLVYEGNEISVYNFQVFAGTVVLPDLHIRHRIRLEDDSLDDVGPALESAIERSRAQEDAPAAPTTAAARPESPPPPDGPEAPKRRPESKPQPIGTGPAFLAPEKLKAIDKVIRRYLDGGRKPLDGLGRRLADYKRVYSAGSGASKRSKTLWFGFATLRAFVEKTYPHYRLGENSIEEPDREANRTQPRAGGETAAS